MRKNWKNGKRGDIDLRTAVTTKDGVLQKAVHKQLALLLSNPRHPSLNIKKMQDPRDIWEAKISGSYCFTFQIKGDVYILRKVSAYVILKKP